MIIWERVKLKHTPSPQHLGMEHSTNCQPHQHMDPNGKFESKHFQMFLGPQKMKNPCLTSKPH